MWGLHSVVLMQIVGSGDLNARLVRYRFVGIYQLRVCARFITNFENLFDFDTVQFAFFDCCGLVIFFSAL